MPSHSDDDRPVAGMALPQVPGYRIHSTLADGGSGGRVLRASPDASPRRLVAIKLVPAAGGTEDDPGQLVALQREALALRDLEHPSILQLVDVVTTPTHLALVTPLATGGSLSLRLAAGDRLTAPEVADVGARLASALVRVHDAGLVHRDVKPANVLFDAEGQPLLADLGTAALLGSHPQVSGTVEYLDPRVLDGAPADGSTDVYALGVTLYEALAGVPPYAGSSPAQTIAAARRGIHLRLTDHLDAPPALAAAIELAFARDPGVRIGSAQELAARLASIAGELGTPAIPPPLVTHEPPPGSASGPTGDAPEGQGWAVATGAGALGATSADHRAPAPTASDGGRSRTLVYGRSGPGGSTASGTEVAAPVGTRTWSGMASSTARRWWTGGAAVLAFAAVVLMVASAVSLPDRGREQGDRDHVGREQGGRDPAASGAATAPGAAEASSDAMARVPASACEDGPVIGVPDGATVLAADVDGRGCSVSVIWDGASLAVPRADGTVSRFDVDAGPDDVVLFGAWTCDPVEAPALYRPSTGELFTFGGLALDGQPVTVQGEPTGVVGGVPTVMRDVDGCDRVGLETPSVRR